MTELVPDGPCRWEIPRHGEMRVPAVVFATEAMLPTAVDDRALDQLVNVACLPGIVDAAYAMPDVHWGYGFPIGGVAATDIADGGVVSPGGVGFDISCGVRLLCGEVQRAELGQALQPVMDDLGRKIQRGAGPGGVLRRCGTAEMDQILQRGAAWMVESGMGVAGDLAHCEGGGSLDGADPAAVGAQARDRGAAQVGSLGSGNHFLELQAVDRIFEPVTAGAFGLRPDLICVMIHCGSRGLGHQVCTDYVQAMRAGMRHYDIQVPDPQLACLPVRSPEGERYLGAMLAAANYGMANRQALTHATRSVFDHAGWGRLTLLYDVSHNLAKIETHEVGGRNRTLCVHRKGATRAFPPHHPELPADLAAHGQPVLVPGSMGTASYVLSGVSGSPAFHSACHGAGRVLSRHAALRSIPIGTLRRSLAAAGVLVRGASARGLVEEAPESYKDVDEVVRACEGAGLAKPVARLVPVGVVKG